MFQTPYLADGKITPDMIQYMVKQLKQDVIPKLERISGVKFDIDRLREYLRKSAKAEDDHVWVLQIGQEQALADRRLFRRHLLYRPDLRRLPRHRRRDRLLQASCATRSSSASPTARGR